MGYDRQIRCSLGRRCRTAAGQPSECVCSCRGANHGRDACAGKATMVYRDAAARVSQIPVGGTVELSDGDRVCTLAAMQAYRDDVDLLNRADRRLEYDDRGILVCPAATAEQLDARATVDARAREADAAIAAVEAAVAELDEAAEVAELDDDGLDVELGVDDQSDVDRQLARDEFRDAAEAGGDPDTTSSAVKSAAATRRSSRRPVDVEARSVHAADGASTSESTNSKAGGSRRNVRRTEQSTPAAVESRPADRKASGGQARPVEPTRTRGATEQPVSLDLTVSPASRVAPRQESVRQPASESDGAHSRGQGTGKGDGRTPAPLRTDEPSQARGAGDPTVAHPLPRSVSHTTQPPPVKHAQTAVARPSARQRLDRARQDATAVQPADTPQHATDDMAERDSVDLLAALIVRYTAEQIAAAARWTTVRARIVVWWTADRLAADTVDVPQAAIEAHSQTSPATRLFHEQIGATHRDHDRDEVDR